MMTYYIFLLITYHHSLEIMNYFFFFKVNSLRPAAKLPQVESWPLSLSDKKRELLLPLLTLLHGRQDYFSIPSHHIHLHARTHTHTRKHKIYKCAHCLTQSITLCVGMNTVCLN